MKKRLLALLLCLVLLLGALPIAALAAEVYVDLRLPIAQNVVGQSGNDARFTYEITGLAEGVWIDTSDDAMSLELPAGQTYVQGEIGFRLYGDSFAALQTALEKGFQVQEVIYNLAGWTLDTNRWYVLPQNYEKALKVGGEISSFLCYDLNKLGLGQSVSGTAIPKNAKAEQISFTNTYDGSSQGLNFTLAIPYTVTVQVKGNGAAPAKSFRISLDQDALNSSLTLIKIAGNTIETNGAGTYSGTLELTFAATDLNMVYYSLQKAGLLVSETVVAAGGWTYDTAVCQVLLEFVSTESASLENAEIAYHFLYNGMEASAMKFTNLYTASDAAASGTKSKTFTDVPTTAWYYADVMKAVQQGLVNGKTETTYCPDQFLTYAEAVKLAACLCQRDLQGYVSLTNSTDGDPWYMSYNYYAIANDIETFNVGFDPEEANSYVSREHFVAILYGALEEPYPAINTVYDSAIPDYPAGKQYAYEVYGFYRAGILTGDTDGSFRPDDNIKRSEVAAILTRMTDPSSRKSVTLTKIYASTGESFRPISFADGEYLGVAALGLCGPGEYSLYDEHWYEKVTYCGYNWMDDAVTVVDLGGDEIYFLAANTDYGPAAVYNTNGTYVASGQVIFLRCGGPEYFPRCKVEVGTEYGGVIYELALSGEDGLPVRAEGVVLINEGEYRESPDDKGVLDNLFPDGYYDSLFAPDSNAAPLDYPLSNEHLWTNLVLTYDGLYGNDLWVWADEVKVENGYITEYLGTGYNYYLSSEGQFFVPDYSPEDADGLTCVNAQNFAEYVQSFPNGVICDAMVRTDHEGGEIVEIYQAVVLSVG